MSATSEPRAWGALCAGVMLCGALQAHAEPLPGSCPAEAELSTHLACIERTALAAQPGRALRYGGVLLVISGRKIHPRFNWGGTPATPEVSYFYQAFDARMNAHVLRYTSGSGSGVELIHDRSGQHLQSVGQAPNFSPDGELVATISDTQQMRSAEIQIWRIGQQGFINLAKHYPQGWKPAAGPHVWLDADTLQIARACAEPAAEKPTCGTVQFRRSAGVWKVIL